MDSRRSTAACLLMMAAATWVSAAAAQETGARDIGVEQQRLVDYRAQLSTLEREQSALQQQIRSKQQALEELRSRPAPEQAELTAARREVDEARAAFETAPGSDGEARLKNAEFKLTLAERKASKDSPQAAALAEEIEQLQARAGSRQNQIATLRQQIDTQASRTSQLQQRLADERSRREQQAQELARTREEADQAQREIERLKALLASREAAEAPITETAPAAEAEAATATAAAPAATTTAAAAVQTLGNQGDVVAALQQLEQRLASEGDKRVRTVNEILHLKRLQNGEEVAKSRVTLRALGAQQYRGTETLVPGDYEMVLGFNRWPLKLDGSHSGDMVFLLDYRDTGKPQIQLYKRSLEGG
jgi:chromosome segregation ATPase